MMWKKILGVGWAVLFVPASLNVVLIMLVGDLGNMGSGAYEPTLLYPTVYTLPIVFLLGALAAFDKAGLSKYSTILVLLPLIPLTYYVMYLVTF